MPQAGLLELVAHGIQDIYLIGNPQITFFKSIYKRHTNFSMEAYQISYDAKPTYGAKTTFNITRYADLMYTMILEVDLPKLYTQYTYDTYDTINLPITYIKGCGDISWVNNTGHALINYCDLTIGKQIIDRQYGEWMEIWSQLSQSESKKRGLDLMLNRNSELQPKSDALSLYIPLQFWFCRNLGLALPLIALQYHDVHLEVNFRNLSQLYTFGANNYYNVTSTGTNTIHVYKPYPTQTPSLTNSVQAKIMVFPNNSTYFINPVLNIGGTGQTGLPGSPYILIMTQNIPACSNVSVYIKPNGILNTNYNYAITEVKLYVDYIYLDTIEQKEFANAKHRYLIEQLQYSGTQSITGGKLTEKIKLNFNLPVKELFWVNQLSSVYNTNDLFNYSNTVDPVVTQDNIITNSQIVINGIERFSKRNSNYFRLIQPYQKHTRSPNNFVYIYSFAIKPEEHQPSGCSNFSKLDTKELFFNISPNTGTHQVRVYALNYNILRITKGMGGVAFSS